MSALKASGSSSPSALARFFSAEVAARPIDLFRIASGVIYLVYFGAAWQSFAPLASAVSTSPAARAFASFGPVLGLLCSAAFALGFLPRIAALLIFVVSLALDAALPALRYPDDEVARVLAFLLLWLPWTAPQRAPQRAPRRRGRLLSLRTGAVPGINLRLFLVCTAFCPLYVELVLRSTGTLDRTGFWLCCLAPGLAWLGRLPHSRGPALIVHVGVLLIVLGATALPFTTAWLVAAAPLFHCIRPVPGEARLRADSGTALLTAFLIAWLAYTSAPSPLLESVRHTGLRLLADSHLQLRPPDARQSAALGATPALGIASRGMTVGDAPYFARYGVRAALLLDTLTQPNAEAEEQRLARAFTAQIARAHCRRATGPGPFELTRAGRDSPLSRFDCARGGRVLPSDLEADALPDARALAAHAPEHFPLQPAPSAYAGSEACADCHATQRAQLARSNHARSRRSGSAMDSIVGRFDGGSLPMPGGSIVLARDAEGAFMEIHAGDRRERRRVSGVLGAGKRSQAYFEHASDGIERLLPLLFSTDTQSWLPLAVAFPETRDPRAHWAEERIEVPEQSCNRCHASASYVSASAGVVREQLVDESVGCEGCHGPLAGHQPKAGEVVAADSLRARAEQSCALCHARHAAFRVSAPEPRLATEFALALDDPSLRADGAAYLASGLEGTAFELSRCQREGGARCTSCHDPHTLGLRPARATDDKSPDALCTQCHERFATETAQSEHSHHASQIACAACHMPAFAARDEPRAGSSGTNHRIDVPHPRESSELAIPNACDNCHRERGRDFELSALERWKQTRALEVRPDVRAIARSKSGAKDQGRALIDMLAPDAPPLLLVSALRLLMNQPTDPSFLPALEGCSAHAMPEVRAAALAALAVHDPAGAARYQQRGSHDAHPFVRLMSFELGAALGLLRESDKRRELRDVLETATRPPLVALEGLAHLRELAGEYDQASSLLRLAARYASPAQHERDRLDAWVRALSERAPLADKRGP